MKIHFIVRSLREEGAGSHQNAISYIRYLKERGHVVTVHAITSFNNPPSDITLIEHGKEALGFTAGNRFLADLLHTNEKDVDLFFLYGVDTIWGGGRYRKTGGVTPVVVYLDTCLSTMSGGQRQSLGYYLKRLFWERVFGMRDAAWVDGYIAASPFIKEVYNRAGFPVDAFHIVPNFFELEEISHNRVEHTGLSAPLRLLYAGRVTRDKGTDLLIEAVRGISKDLPWQLQIVGDGPLLEECKDAALSYHIEDRVVFTPWVSQSELSQVYAAADIFVHPSRVPEAFGRTFVEAMSFGIPVIASNIGAAPWTVGDAGLFFPKENVHELRVLIEKFLSDVSLRTHLGEKGRQRVRAFSKDSVGPVLDGALHEIVANMHPSVPSVAL